MDLGIGRGDSARRVLGKAPTTMATLEEAVHVIRALVEGRPIEYEGAAAPAHLDRRATGSRSGSPATGPSRSA